MKNQILRMPVIAIALMIAPLTTLHADDTEIYVTESELNRDPNVMFIMDTSGSMGSLMEVPGEPYDASKDYSGDCESDRIYWSRPSRFGNTQEPECPTDQWINTDDMQCGGVNDSLSSDSGMAIADAGIYREVTQDVTERQCTTERRCFFFYCRDVQVCEDVKVDEETVLVADELQGGERGEPVECRDEGNPETHHFYTANYLNWHHSDLSDSTYESRLDIVRDIAKKVTDSISGVNIGLMRFDRDAQGGYVDLAIGPVEEQRTAFQDKLDEYYANGNTPLAETLYESARYWRGEDVLYGDYSEPGLSVDASRTSAGSGTYQSPIEHECQKNHTVYLTDGAPRGDSGADDLIDALTGVEGDGNRTDELAKFLYENDQRSSVDRMNRVISHMVGFTDGVDESLMRAAGREGGGKFYPTSNYEELEDALTQLFTEIVSGNSLFSAPAVTVNAFNRLNNLDQVYFALFRPGSRARWAGNVKRYKLDAANDQLLDADDEPAVNPATGQFKDNIRSFWSAQEDGSAVTRGGAAGELTLPRDVYTYTGTGSAELTAASSSADTALHEDNDEITPADLGLASDETAYRDRILEWARGVDVDDRDGDGSETDARRFMGDPLHSTPALVTYGETASDPQLTLFSATNEGYIHAIDAETGQELWAFMPKEVLTNLPGLYENPESTNRLYGLDGPLSVRRDDGNVYLYASMRRGGHSYYALDITDRESPELLWTLTGGADGPEDFVELGQTWSKPIPTTVDIDGTATDVLLFAGGYDVNQDDSATRSADLHGRALFMIDADTGDLLWSGGPPSQGHDEGFDAMSYSIPSDVRAIDIDSDGLVDQIYVGDMGGQLWRFDVANGEPVADLVTGGVIAELSQDDDATNTRRFYYPPDVSLVNGDSGQYFAISIGSGWRAHPLDQQVEDRFYVLREDDVYGPPTDADGNISYEKITHEDLFDTTDNLIGEGDSTEQDDADALLADSEGWYIDLENSGEKVLAPSVTLDGEIVFTTFQPQGDSSSSSCGASQGIGRTYVVDVIDGTPTEDRDDDGTETSEDRSVLLKRGGIPPGPTVLLTEDGTSVLIGPEQPIQVNNQRKREIYWRQD